MSSQPNPESQRHRPFLYVAGGGSGLAYALVHLAANIVPFYNHEHGWPLVYMIRETGRSGEYTRFGPWPWDDPPIVEFSTPILVLDGLIGVMMTLLVAGCFVYWLGDRPRFFRFSLRGLFGVMSVAALLAALGMYFELSRWDILESITLGLRWLVFVGPCFLVMTAAHWAACRSIESPLRFRWCGLHGLTWIAIVAIGIPFLHYSFWAWTDYVSSGNVNLDRPGSIGLAGYGWPATYMAEYNDTEPIRLAYKNEGWGISFYDPIALLVDILTSLVVIASVAFVVERWIRRIESRAPFRLGTGLGAVLAVSLLVAVLMTDTAHGPDWYDYPSWLFGVLSAIYAIEVLVFRGVELVFRKFPWKVLGQPR